MTEVNFESLNIYDTEANLEFRYKFSVVLMERMYECYARTDVECKLWVQTFARVIDYIKGISAEVSGVKSTHYDTLRRGLD